MQLIDSRILEAADSRLKQEPCAFVDVYADIAERVAIDSTSQWTGTNDPMVGSDSNVAFDRVVGAVTLAKGASVAAVYTGPDVLADTASMTAYVIAHWHTEGSWISGTHAVHDNFDKIVTFQDNETTYQFTAGATSIIDSVIVRAKYAGYTSRQCYARIIDSKGNQVGKIANFTPTTSVTTITISGLSASVYNGSDYTLIVGFLPFTSGELPDPYFVPRTDYSYTLSVYAYTVASTTWRIDTGAVAFSTGGHEGYQASGSLTRQFDMGAVPSGDGTLTFVDTVPSGSTQVVTMYYTDSDAVALETNMTNWTLLGVRESGDTLPAHKYWRASIAMTANASNDSAPVMARIEVTYKDAPITLGTHAALSTFSLTGYSVPWAPPIYPITTIDTRRTGAKALDKISTVSAQMSPQVASSMIGRMTMSLAPELAVNDLASKQLRGKLAVVRVGFVLDGSPVASEIYKGIVEDITWNGDHYTLTIKDDMDIVDVKVPREKVGDVWSAATDYVIGDDVVYGTASYNALANSGPGYGGAVTPGTDPATWDDTGTVWVNIVYSSITSPDAPTDWHLADVCADLLQNHINIPTQRIDLESIALVKAAFPNMRGSRTITKPVGAIELLTELAWLLGSQWVMRQGKLALVEESTAAATEFIQDKDIKANISYSRGFKNLKNECLILSGYSGDGGGDEQFLQSYAYADSTSIADYEMVGLEVFKDKWNVDSAELTTRATTYVNRWKDGRRTITNLHCAMRLLPLEVGDVTAFSSIMLPPFDQGAKDYIIIKRDLDWFGQSLTMSLMEI